jgi:hypothetical protein
MEVFDIEMKNHPVKVGVSDAFSIDTIRGGNDRIKVLYMKDIASIISQLQIFILCKISKLTMC